MSLQERLPKERKKWKGKKLSIFIGVCK